MNYYILENKKVPGGDYGDILFKGFLNTFTYEEMEVKKMMRGKKVDGKYTFEERIVKESKMVDLEYPELERAGPYIPEIYIINSTYIVIIDRLKSILENSGITGIQNFKKVITKKIVDINWTEWGNFDDEINNLIEKTETGEPEDIIWKAESNEKIKKSMPDVWCAEIQEETNTLKIISDRNNNERYSLSKVPDKDISIPENMLYIIVSDKFKDLMKQNNIETIIFKNLN